MNQFAKFGLIGLTLVAAGAVIAKRVSEKKAIAAAPAQAVASVKAEPLPETKAASITENEAYRTEVGAKFQTLFNNILDNQVVEQVSDAGILYRTGQAAPTRLPFNKAWNGTTCYVEPALVAADLKALPAGQYVTHDADSNRRMIILVGPKKEIAVIFERYTAGGEGIIVQQTARSGFGGTCECTVPNLYKFFNEFCQ